MALVPGSRLGVFEVVSLLGEGGMGQVYRARDTKLNRDVALKILPESFALADDRVARFRREAQMLAALNHPNIAHIYGFEDSGSTHALVLELVEGPTLADRIAKGPIPLDETLPIAKQIAEALEAAHEQGIIHRDLKPANITVRDDGTVKVLDFGLAKALDPASVISPMLTNSPTITTPAQMTGVGMILGTAAYMSPEQAKGRPADKRSDVWAFGCVLYEMLTGKRAFEGEDVADTLAAILRSDPAWVALPSTTPQSLRIALRGCLDKDRRTRFPEIAVARFAIEGRFASEQRLESNRKSRASSLWQLVAGLALLAAVISVFLSYRWRATNVALTKFLITPPGKTVFMTGDRVSASVVVSPDGRSLVFATREPDGVKPKLWIRAVNSVLARPLAATEGALFPFWSPDSKSIAYFSADKLQRIDVSGGPPQIVCDCNGRGGAWGRGGVIVFNNGPGPLFQVSASGGKPSPFTRLADGEGSHVFPSFLPDGRHVLYFAIANVVGSRLLRGRVAVASLDDGETHSLVDASTGAVYSSEARSLLFVRDGTLFAQPFNTSTLTLAGDAQPVAEGVSTAVYNGVISFSVSDTGTLAYGQGTGSATPLQLVEVDRHGTLLRTVGDPQDYRGIDLSPDGKQLVAHRQDGTGGDLWIIDLVTNATSRFTFDPMHNNSSPIWSADGRHVLYSSMGGNKPAIYQRAVDGSTPEEELFEVDSRSGQTAPMPSSMTRDGQTLVFTVSNTKTRDDIWWLSLAGDRKSVPFLTSQFNESEGQVSPDGHWLVYFSNADGGNTFVRSFPRGTAQWQVSSRFGGWPRWRGDGKELFFIDSQSQGRMMAVDVMETGSTVRFGSPHPLFDSGFIFFPAVLSYNGFAVSRDGQRFYIPRLPSLSAEGKDQSPIVVVLNWFEELKQRVPVK